METKKVFFVFHIAALAKADFEFVAMRLICRMMDGVLSYHIILGCIRTTLQQSTKKCSLVGIGLSQLLQWPARMATPQETQQINYF